MKKVLILAVTLLAALPWPLPAKNLCTEKGYILGYFNGVQNTEHQATISLDALKSKTGSTYNDQPVTGEVMYNQTNGLTDFAEVFIQKANEVDITGTLARHFEFLWELNNDGEKTWWDALSASLAVEQYIETLLTDLLKDWQTIVTGTIAALISTPPTASDYQEIQARLETLALEQSKLLLVAHSQGNLFVNNAYDYIAAKVGSDAVKVVHIAPASATLRGEYVLANIDFIINSLGLLYNVPEANLTLPYARADISGHNLVTTYLDPARAGEARIRTMLFDALSQLQPPPTRGKVGAFTVTMTWDPVGDVDLHTFEPTGDHVYYLNKRGSNGYLDVDSVGDEPEHYYAWCESDELSAGDYRIALNNYRAPAGTVATVQAASARDGVLITRQVTLGQPLGGSGNRNPTPVLQVRVTKDANGEVAITGQ